MEIYSSNYCHIKCGNGDSLAAVESSERKSFYERVDTAAKIVKENVEDNKYIRIVSHIDADGLSAASILSRTLERMETSFRVRIGKQLNEEIIKDLSVETNSLIIFTDFGSGSLDLIKDKLSANEIIILDHHEPMNLSFPKLCHVNPHFWGFNGTRDISGAGVAYLLSKALDKSNVDLASLAVIGALGDRQDISKKRSLKSLNEELVKDAVDSGNMQVETDLIFYGRETRPIHKALAYTTSPYIPDLSGEEDKSLGLLVNLGIKLKDNDRWRAIADLSSEEKQKIFSELAKHLSARRYPNSVAFSLIGTVYTLTKEDRWTPLRDAREYASLLNACGRMKKSGLGVSIAIGSRRKNIDEAHLVLSNYKKALAEYIDWLRRTPRSVERLENINVIDGSGVIDELMLGVITSIATSSNFFDDSKPIIAFTTTEDRRVKISGRISNSASKIGLNLGTIFQKASARFRGRGGGHDVAAGAELPKGIENDFIRFVDNLVGATISAKPQ